MSLLRYPLVAALLALFLGGLASAPAGDEADSAPATAGEARNAQDSARRDEAKPSSSSDTQACPSSAN